MDAFEREELDLEERLRRDEISIQEFNHEMKEVNRDRRQAAEEAAQDAYEREMDDWNHT